MNFTGCFCPGDKCQSPLDDLCEPRSFLLAAQKSEKLGRYFPAVSRALFAAQGCLRSAIIPLKEAAGIYSLPCIFVCGGVMGTAVSVIAYRRRIRVISKSTLKEFMCNSAKIIPSTHDASASSVESGQYGNYYACAQCIPLTHLKLEQLNERIISRSASSFKHNSSYITKQSSEDDEIDKHVPRVSDLFTPAELFMLFFAPAVVISATMTVFWLSFKGFSGVENLEHFLLLIRWMNGKGLRPVEGINGVPTTTGEKY